MLCKDGQNSSGLVKKVAVTFDSTGKCFTNTKLLINNHTHVPFVYISTTMTIKNKMAGHLHSHSAVI